MKHRRDLNLIKINHDIEVSYLFDLLTAYIEDAEDTNLLLATTEFVLREIDAYGTTDNSNIAKCRELIKNFT